MLWLGHESRPVLEFRPVAALADEGLVEQPFRDDHMRQRGDDSDIGAGFQRQMVVRLGVDRGDSLGLARVEHD
ncbi:hypothetical protein D3C72_1898130 [compost metagenome]